MYKRALFLTLFFFNFFLLNEAISENLKISYVDIDKIISESLVGQKINKSIDKFINKKNKDFQKIEENLKKKDTEIVKQQNILSKDELNKKIQDLQSEIKEYRNQKEKFNKNISEKKINETSQMVSYLNKILGKYASENSISLIIQKKNIVIGKSEMDITKQILDIFNKEVKEVKLN